MRRMIKQIWDWFWRRPIYYDAILFSLLTLSLLWNPYYLYQTLNLFELGLYLPGIDGILHGQVPYRDFFHLRGPFELYLPAFLMRLSGQHIAVLSTYFYIGNVLTLMICGWLACSIYPSRLFFYSMAFVLITRTFPRVVFTYWGGMRYVWGLLAVLCLVWFLKKNQKRWILMAGLLTATAGFTSVEIGWSAFAAFITVIVFDLRRRQILSLFSAGVGIIAVPYLLYLFHQNALGDYINAQWVVATHMTKTFFQTEVVPSDLGQFLHAVFIVSDKNFRQLTPVYCYLAFAFYLFWRWRQAQMDWQDKAAGVIAMYGLTIYATGFRNLWSNVFEMALQPEKIVLFYLWAGLYLHLSQQHYKKISYVLILLVISFSLGYSVNRFCKRFRQFHFRPLKESFFALDLPRAKNLKIPRWQAADLIQLKQFVDGHTNPGESVWMYPELGALHFILDRPCVGKFPTATLAWMDEQWYAQYMRELMLRKPRYAIVNKATPDYFEKAYFPAPGNREKFWTQTNYLKLHYSLISSTPTYNIYLRQN